MELVSVEEKFVHVECVVSGYNVCVVLLIHCMIVEKLCTCASSECSEWGRFRSSRCEETRLEDVSWSWRSQLFWINTVRKNHLAIPAHYSLLPRNHVHRLHRLNRIKLHKCKVYKSYAHIFVPSYSPQCGSRVLLPSNALKQIILHQGLRLIKFEETGSSKHFTFLVGSLIRFSWISGTSSRWTVLTCLDVTQKCRSKLRRSCYFWHLSEPVCWCGFAGTPSSTLWQIQDERFCVRE